MRTVSRIEDVAIPTSAGGEPEAAALLLRKAAALFAAGLPRSY